MTQEPMVFYIFVIFTGAALLSTLALYTRQSLLVAYMVLGMLLGPWGLKLVADSNTVSHVGEVGITFLLFLLGLHLSPRDLMGMFRKALPVTLFASLIFIGISFGIAYIFGFSRTDSLLIGTALMFSSTIIGLKLLPTTVLHHQHTGDVMISILLMQDLLAILVLLILNAAGQEGGFSFNDFAVAGISLPCLLVFAFLAERWVLRRLIGRFDQVKEYVFLLAIGWCLGMAELGSLVGLNDGIGAFIGGISIAASSPIAYYIAENLKPLRDFFLVMFFFSIGAGFNFEYLPEVIVPAIILAMVLMVAKPWIFSWFLRAAGENKKISTEVGMRLGQASEFSLLVVFMATQSNPPLMSAEANYLIGAATIISFIVSCYLVVWRYQTPISFSEKLRRD